MFNCSTYNFICLSNRTQNYIIQNCSPFRVKLSYCVDYTSLIDAGIWMLRDFTRCVLHLCLPTIHP